MTAPAPAPDVVVRALTEADAVAYRALRLEALRDAPRAFATSYEEELARPLEATVERLRPKTDAAAFGAFEGERLVGMCSVFRLERRTERHKAFLVAMYVTPDARRRGVARALVAATLARARAMDGVRQVLLGVAADNAAARALYEGFGFEAFGYEREALLVEGAWVDEVHMVLVLEP